MSDALFADAVDDLFNAAELGVVAGVYTAAAGSGVALACRVLTSTRDEEIRQGRSGARSPGLKASIPVADLAALGRRPERNDGVTIDGVAHVVRDVRVDPAGATYDLDVDRAA